MQPSVIGLFVGLILGLILEIDGFGAMVVTAVIGLIGYVVGKVLQGEIDLGELIDRTRRPQQ